MNLKEIEYIIKIAEERNVTRAAEKLYITPSALNQQLLHLEREIGTPLFHRSRTGWTPTEAGKVYLDAAQEMLRMKKETYHKLQDIVNTKKGTLSIGFPPERGTSMFTNVYPAFHQQYPDIVLNVVETNVRKQQKLITRGELDVGFVTLRSNQCTDDDYIPICTEELVLAVPSNHPACSMATADDTGPYPVLPIRAVRYEPFALMYKESTIYPCIDSMFRQAGFFPTVLFETVRAATIMDIVAANLCCSIIPNSDSLPHPDGVSLFCLPDHPSWNIMAVVRKGSYLTRPARLFISLATEYWQNRKGPESPA